MALWVLFSSEKRIVIDVASLLHHTSCARNNISAYEAHNYMPSITEFQRYMIYLAYTCRWNLVVVFDGKESELKRHEHQRRDARMFRAQLKRDDGNDSSPVLRNLTLYIALTSKYAAIYRFLTLLPQRKPILSAHMY